MFRGATRSDMDTILSIYARAREFMAQNGNPTQWGGTNPTKEQIEADIDSNRLFVYVQKGEIEAVFALIIGEEPTYRVIESGAWLDNSVPYGTIHRLASAGTQKGVAGQVIEWCSERCESLRADTHADNRIMQHILEENGFARCGIIHIADGSPRIAYQKLNTRRERAE